MKQASTTLISLPSFDTGCYEGCEFLMTGGDAVLTIHVSGIPSIKLHFARVRWHQFTALYNCTPEQINGAYFAVAETLHSRSLAAYIANDKAGAKAYRELHHYRVFLDETGCHELYAQSHLLSE